MALPSGSVPPVHVSLGSGCGIEARRLQPLGHPSTLKIDYILSYVSFIVKFNE